MFNFIVSCSIFLLESANWFWVTWLFSSCFIFSVNLFISDDIFIIVEYKLEIMESLSCSTNGIIIFIGSSKFFGINVNLNFDKSSIIDTE